MDILILLIIFKIFTIILKFKIRSQMNLIFIYIILVIIFLLKIIINLNVFYRALKVVIYMIMSILPYVCTVKTNIT